MADWTHGYVAEIDYTYGFYREQTPAILATAALARGYAAPDPSGPLTYCELGCGQGLSVNLLAAANPNIEFYATDFNPNQIASAQKLAAEAGNINAHFSDAAFDEYVEDPSLPQFDIIALHGIYSWVSDENRATIVEFLRRKLKPGGLVYVSYNALPGWSAAMPMRRIFTEHSANSGGTLTQRIEKALAFSQRLHDSGVRYYQNVPGMADRLKGIATHNRNYVAHEYFNTHWTPLYFADTVRELDGAKLSWVGSVHMLDHVDAINFTPEHRALLLEVPDPILQETVRDYMTMAPFRRDLFGRGLVPLTAGEAQQAWLNMRLALSIKWPGTDMKIKGALGDADLQPDSYTPVLDLLATGPKIVAQLLQDKTIAAFGWTRLQEVLRVLIGAGWAQPCASPKDESKRAARTKAFNQAVMRRSIYSTDIAYLASPVTGGGVAVDRFSQMMILAMQEKHPDPPLRAWEQIAAQGHSLLKDGKAMADPEDNIAELRRRYETFGETGLATLKQLGIL